MGGGSAVLSGGSCDRVTAVDGDGAVKERLGMTLPRGVYSRVGWGCNEDDDDDDVLPPLGKEEDGEVVL